MLQLFYVFMPSGCLSMRMNTESNLTDKKAASRFFSPGKGSESADSSTKMQNSLKANIYMGLMGI